MLRKRIKKNFDKIVYSSATINKIMRNVNKAFKGFTSFRLRPYGILTVKYGTVTFKMATNQTSFVTKQLFWKGAANFEYTPIFEHLARSCSTFIDIGANSGYYSMLAAKVNPRIIVHAFEPASGPYHFLTRNIQINRLEDRVFAHAVALSNQKGDVEFFEMINASDTIAKYNLSGVGALKKIHETQKNSIRRTVRAETLDEYSQQVGISPIHLIKIDTEGTEDLVLEGLANIIDRHKPIIICETLFNKIEDKLERIMKRHGYLFFNHFQGKLHRTPTLIRTVDNGVSDCFFLPPHKIQQAEKFIAK